MQGVDWSKPITSWPKDVMVKFLLQAMKLIHAAMIARDVGGGITTKGKSLEEMQRIAVSRGWRTIDDARRNERSDSVLRRGIWAKRIRSNVARPIFMLRRWRRCCC